MSAVVLDRLLYALGVVMAGVNRVGKGLLEMAEVGAESAEAD
jgi:hypothetical protein